MFKTPWKRKWPRSKGFVTKAEGKNFVVCVYFDRDFTKDFSVVCFRRRKDQDPLCHKGDVVPLRRNEARELGWLFIRAFVATWPHVIGWLLFLWRPRK